MPGLLPGGTITNTAPVTDSPTGVSGRLTDTVQNVNVLAGAVTASVITADVSANGNPPTLGDASSFVGLQVRGFPALTDNVPANTRLTLVPGVYVYLHRRVQTATAVTVVMIQIVVTGTNSLLLPQGLVINVGAASVGVA